MDARNAARIGYSFETHVFVVSFCNKSHRPVVDLYSGAPQRETISTSD